MMIEKAAIPEIARSHAKTGDPPDQRGKETAAGLWVGNMDRVGRQAEFSMKQTLRHLEEWH
jgi:hypothetical protein